MFSLRLHKEPRFLEWKSEPSRSVIVAGVGRSGTTWLGDVISHMINARVIFEPCVLGSHGNFLINNNGHINLDLRIEKPSKSLSFKDFTKEKNLYMQMFFGNIKGDWIDQDVRSGVFFKRVVKVIRANMFIGYIARCWPQVKIIYVIRSPEKVIESMLTQELNGWKFDWKAEDILNSLEELSEWAELKNFLDWDKANIIDRLTMRWCIEMKTALKTIQNQKNIMLVQYESLVQGDGWADLALFLKDRGGNNLPSEHILKKQSKTGYEGKRFTKLNAEQINRIHMIVIIFGLKQWIV